MTAPKQRKNTSWEDLTPWDKAAEWYSVAPEIAEQVMALAKRHAEHQWAMDQKRAEHEQRMDVRVWVTQLAALAIGLINVLVLAIVAWHYADTGNVVPGLTVFGAGAGLTAGAYGVGKMLGNRAASKKGSAQT
ncbi:hypothetical protein [Actinocrispum wychmicini]|uniref:Putative membrane protein n=1 Tax=Actinocrispum wychmicini TaxID=1213861 RepID=A0A4R2JK63_9PSEU|nr:hypothetical protein [Actinocrispum wychmicini]TCO56919.1 putative membrane protein [Actinocrispum wychmicini]